MSDYIEYKERALGWVKELYHVINERNLGFSLESDEDSVAITHTLLDGRRHRVCLYVIDTCKEPTTLYVESRLFTREAVGVPEKHFLDVNIDEKGLKRFIQSLILGPTPEHLLCWFQAQQRVYELTVLTDMVFERNKDVVILMQGNGVGLFDIRINNVNNRHYNKRIAEKSFQSMFNKYAKVMKRYPILAEKPTKQIVKDLYNPICQVNRMNLLFLQDLTYFDEQGDKVASDFLSQSGWETLVDIEQDVGTILIVQTGDGWKVQYKIEGKFDYRNIDPNALAERLEDRGIRYSERFDNVELYKYWWLYQACSVVNNEVMDVLERAMNVIDYTKIVGIIDEIGWRKIYQDDYVKSIKYHNDLVIGLDQQDTPQVQYHGDVVAICKDKTDNELSQLFRLLDQMIGWDNQCYYRMDNGVQEIIKLEIDTKPQTEEYELNLTYIRDHVVIHQHRYTRTIYSFDRQYDYYYRKVINPIKDYIKQWMVKYPTTTIEQLYQSVLEKFRL